MVCYNTGMTVEKATVEFGQAITFDGGQWGEIVNASGDTVWVLDQEGGEHELHVDRLD